MDKTPNKPNSKEEVTLESIKETLDDVNASLLAFVGISAILFSIIIVLLIYIIAHTPY